MHSIEIEKANSLKGEITIPGDKSISHRAIMLGSLAQGKTEIRNFLLSADCLSTINCFKKLGIDISLNNNNVTILGKGLRGLNEPTDTLFTDNSGTTTRLLSGILCAQIFSSVIDGDSSLRKRPMKRIISPLTLMGADIKGNADTDCVPLKINGRRLKGIHYDSPIASAQVKSAILLAGLYAEGKTCVNETYLSRNHTELMIKSFGASIYTNGTTCEINQTENLFATDLCVPGDISSAAYFIVAALIIPNSEVLIKNVGINPTRDGLLSIVNEMGGNITILNKRLEGYEEVADILVKSSELKGITIEGKIIPRIIDEIPIIAILSCFAKGRTIVKNAEELKYKESNRIDTVVNNLALMGAQITGTDDGMIIDGGKELRGAIINSNMDHRIAMSFYIAGLASSGKTKILGSECVDISYPRFYNDIIPLIH